MSATPGVFLIVFGFGLNTIFSWDQVLTGALTLHRGLVYGAGPLIQRPAQEIDLGSPE